MGKRKADVLTGSESVDEWLNAGHRLPEHTAAARESPDSVRTCLGIAAVSEPSHPTVVPAEANRLTPLPVPVEACSNRGGSRGPRGEGPADEAVPPQTSEGDIPADLTSEGLGPRTVAAVEAFWALLEELGYEPV